MTFQWCVVDLALPPRTHNAIHTDKHCPDSGRGLTDHTCVACSFARSSTSLTQTALAVFMVLTSSACCSWYDLFRGPERAALTTSPCTSQLGYIVEPNTIKKSRLYTLDGACVFGCQGVV